MKFVFFMCTIILSQNFCFALTPNIIERRVGHTATVLENGDVFVVGGDNGVLKTLVTSEIYNSKSNSWKRAAPLKISRSNHTAIKLLNGKVLVAGGSSDNSPNADRTLASTEIYDPNLDIWTEASPMHYSRSRQSAVLLPNGQVLVVGGHQEHQIVHAEIYDPQTDTWTINNIIKPEAPDTLKIVSLKNGNILFLSANLGNKKSYAQIYDFKKNTFSNVTAGEPRVRYDAVLLEDGRVLVAGGKAEYEVTNSAEIFDPIQNKWSHVKPMINGHSFHTMTVLSDGKVLVEGGRTFVKDNTGLVSVQETVNSEVYDPKSDTWEKVGSLRDKRAVHTASLLTNGDVLVVGGYADFDVVSSCERFDSQTRSWK